MTDPYVGEVIALWNAKLVSPIEGWPVRWSAWVVQGLGELERAQSIAQADRARREAGGS